MKSLDLIDNTTIKVERAVALNNAIVSSIFSQDNSKDKDVLAFMLKDILEELENEMSDIYTAVATELEESN